MSTAGSNVCSGPAATDGMVRDGYAAASSNLLGLFHEPEGEETSQRSPKRCRAELRTKLKDAILVRKNAAGLYLIDSSRQFTALGIFITFEMFQLLPSDLQP